MHINFDMPIDFIRLSRKGLQKTSHQPAVIPLEAVPDEILEHILSFCVVREILAISLTCRRLFRVASGALYCHVKPVNAKKAIEFLLAVCIHENAGSFVRRCELFLSFNYTLSTSPPQRNLLNENAFSKRILKFLAMKIPCPPRDILYNPLVLAAAALKKMPRLTHLELLFPEKEIQTDYNAQLLGECPFQLYHFHTNLRFDSAMITFLKSQRHLQDFRFYSSTPISSLDMTVLNKDMLPRLSSLSWSNRVPMELVRWLVKGRPINTVNIFLLIGVYDILDFLAIGPSSCHITRANVTFQDHRYPMYSQLNAINIHFPNLVGLGLTVVSLKEGFINDLYRVLKHFKHLERLFIHDQSHESLLTQSAILQYAKLFWIRCISLRRIEFYVCDPFVMVERVTTETGKSKTVLWIVRW